MMNVQLSLFLMIIEIFIGTILGFYMPTIPGVRVRLSNLEHIRRSPINYRNREEEVQSQERETHVPKKRRWRINERDFGSRRRHFPVEFNYDETVESATEFEGPRNLKINIQNLGMEERDESSRRRAMASEEEAEERQRETEIQQKKTELEEIVEDTLDLFEALRLEKPDFCSNCPQLFMPQNETMETLCSNYDAISTFFAMGIDSKRGDTEEWSDNEKCTIKISCNLPHMLVKWEDSEMCDVHAPTEGDEKFTYTCKEGQWFMHGYPVKQVICGLPAN